jgi:hypothetical protein
MPRNFSIHWLPLIPGWIIALAAGVLLALLTIGSLHLLRKRIPPRWVVVLAILRTLAVLLFVFGLLQPTITYRRQVPKLPELMVLVDASQSMGQKDTTADRTRLEEIVARLQQSGLSTSLEGQFRAHWFAFDSQSYLIDVANLDSLQPRGTTTQYARSLSSAFDLLNATGDGEQASATNVKRVILISDGHDRGRRRHDRAQRINDAQRANDGKYSRGTSRTARVVGVGNAISCYASTGVGSGNGRDAQFI